SVLWPATWSVPSRATQLAAPTSDANSESLSTSGTIDSLCGKVTEIPLSSPERTAITRSGRSRAGVGSATYSASMFSSPKIRRNSRGESECPTGSPITANLDRAGTAPLLITLGGTPFLATDRNGAAAEAREQLEKAGEGNVSPFGTVDQRFTSGGEPGDGEAHRNSMVAHGIDRRPLQARRPAHDHSVLQLFHLSGHVSKAASHLRDAVRFFVAQLGRAANGRRSLSLRGEHAQNRQLVNQGRDFRGLDLSCLQPRSRPHRHRRHRFACPI